MAASRDGRAPKTITNTTAELSEPFRSLRNFILDDMASEAPSWVLERLLVLQCQAGDERAFEELVLRYDGRLRYYLRCQLAEEEAADDLLQEVWLDVVRHVGRLRSAGAFRAWLYRIARDKAFGELRRRGLLPKAGIEGAEPAAKDDPEMSAEDAAGIHSCLQRLSVQHREVLLLRFLEDMSYEEIAAAVGCEVGTIRSRLHYAKAALRREMERTGHERLDSPRRTAAGRRLPGES